MNLKFLFVIGLLSLQARLLDVYEAINKKLNQTLAIFNSSIEASAPNFSRPLCEKNGFCHENPFEPSPRTRYSVKSEEEYHDWIRCHTIMKENARSYAQRRSTSDERRPMIFLGDSITESWTGKKMCKKKYRAKTVPKVLEASFSKIVDPLVLAIAGDQTQHLLYRMMHGEWVDEVANDESAIFVLMIGTNNLGNGEQPSKTAQGVRAVVDYLLENVKGKIFLFTILPRGDNFKLCPLRCDSYGQPFNTFTVYIEKVNAEILRWQEELRDRVHIIECGEEFRQPKHRAHIKRELMPDLLHPNRQGHELLAECILDELKHIED